MISKKLFACIFFLTSTVVLYAQYKIVEYKDILPDPFSSYSIPIDIVLFPFTYNGNPTSLDSVFYQELKNVIGIEKKFTIGYHKNIEPLKKNLGIKDWDAANSKVQKQLSSFLNTKLIIYAVLNDSSGNSFTLKIVDTDQGQEVLSEEFNPTINSNAITDAVKLLSENKKSEYQELGRLIVSTKPENGFLVYIDNDSIGVTPCEKFLKAGSYELVIYKYDYEILKDRISIEEGKDLSIERTMKHLPVVGSLQVTASPKDANIELYEGSILINKAAGSLSLDTISTGEYKVVTHLKNYTPESRIIDIQRDKKTELKITLKKELLIINNIVTDNSSIKNLKIEKFDKYFNILYNLMDQADEEYEVKLFLLDKSNEEFSAELKKLTGDFGEGKFYGVGRTIKWNWADEFRGGIANDNLYLKLTVEKLGSGIAWYYYVGAAVLGGTAAILLGSKSKENGGTTSVSLPTPPGRPSN